MSIPSILTFTNVADVVSASAQTTILGQIDVLLNAIPDIDQQSPSGDTPDSPLWNDMTPYMAARLRAELTALKAAIDAAPTS